ncbi:P-loop NTPase [Vibrio harveyi]
MYRKRDSKRFQTGNSEASNLALAYEEAESTDKPLLNKWLKDRFTNCTSTWQSDLFKFDWDRIWTFNIDDVLEHAFNENLASNKFDSFHSYDWKEKIVPREQTINSQQIVYLHGRASDLDTRQEGLVFSISEYAHAAKSFKQWHASFQTNYLEKPFIVCGASLAEEVDLATAIRDKNQSSLIGLPSLIVSFSLDNAQIKRMRRFNLIPIVCPLDEFFEVVHQELKDYESKLDSFTQSLQPGTYHSFLSQFRQLDDTDRSTRAINGSDFYGGDEPTWDDILNNRDVEFVRTSEIKNALKSTSQRYVVVIHGHDVSGKTSSLINVAKRVLEQGLTPFYFRHEDSLNVDTVVDYLCHDEKAVLLIDDVWNYAEPLGRILQQAKNQDCSARIFVTVRNSKLRNVRRDIPDEFRKEFSVGYLKRNDLFKFVQKRRAVSRLGKHFRRRDTEIVNELQSTKRSNLLDTVSHIEFSEPLQERVRRLVSKAVIDPELKSLIARVACVHQFGFSLPLRVAMYASGLAFNQFNRLLENGLKAEGILVRDERGLRLRHKVFSEYAWRTSFSDDERYDAMSEVVSILAPLVNPSVIKAKGKEHLIVREVVDEDNVRKSVGARALEFYSDQEEVLGWSSRYWDQRALLESSIEGHFSIAYSYSQKAISLERHPFAFTSLGAICMRRAIEIFKTNRVEAMDLFREGETALSDAFSISEATARPYEHPFVTFFKKTEDLWKLMDLRSAECDEIIAMQEIWVQRAKDSPLYAGVHGQTTLKDYTRMLLNMKVNRGKHLPSTKSYA